MIRYLKTALRDSRRIEGLTEAEKQVYEFIKGKGRATLKEVMANVSLSELEPKAQLVPLMHSEVVKEHSDGDKVCLIPIL